MEEYRQKKKDNEKSNNEREDWEDKQEELARSSEKNLHVL